MNMVCYFKLDSQILSPMVESVMLEWYCTHQVGW